MYIYIYISCIYVCIYTHTYIYLIWGYVYWIIHNRHKQKPTPEDPVSENRMTGIMFNAFVDLWIDQVMYQLLFHINVYIYMSIYNCIYSCIYTYLDIYICIYIYFYMCMAGQPACSTTQRCQLAQHKDIVSGKQKKRKKPKQKCKWAHNNNIFSICF